MNKEVFFLLLLFCFFFSLNYKQQHPFKKGVFE